MSVLGRLKSIKRIISLNDANHALLSQTHAAIARLESALEQMNLAIKSNEVVLNANQAILKDCQKMLQESAQKEVAVLTTCLESLQSQREQSHAHRAEFDAVNSKLCDLQQGISQLLGKTKV